MTELSFTAWQLSSSAHGMKTTFRFTDGRGHEVAVSINGEVGSDFIDHCRIYYEPEPTAPRLADIDPVLTAPEPADKILAFHEPKFRASIKEIDIVDGYEASTDFDIVRMLEWEFVRLPPLTVMPAGMLR